MKFSFLQVVEEALERTGRFRSVQSLRRMQSLKEYTVDTEYWIEDLINTDIEIREIAQRETFIKEEIDAMEKNLIPRDDAQIHKWQKELELLHYKYLYQEKDYEELVVSCPGETLKRGFHAWQRQPLWHLLPYLRWDCAMRGGCCGRGCGCCEKPRNTKRKAQHGHCTANCGCCQRTRGLGLKAKQQKEYRPLFDRTDPTDYYARYLEAAYIWGLAKDPNPKLSPSD